MDAITALHFIRPGFLLLLPLVLCVYYQQRGRQNASGWQRLLAPGAMRALVDETENKEPGLRAGLAARLEQQTPLWLAFLTLLAVTALAGPSFQTLPNSVASNRHAVIYLLDLSPSMLARDIKPNRVTLAKLKLTDLLQRRNDGESALIVYAGDAHIVAPLSDDADTLVALIDPLHPDIMPLQGSAPENAVDLALTLFDGSAANTGDLVFITDGMHDDAIASIKQALPKAFRLSILGIGTTEGSVIPASDGGALLNAAGDPVTAKLDNEALQALAIELNGRYSSISVDNTDINHLNALFADAVDARRDEESRGFDQRHDAGYWLVLALLPFAAYSFRRQLVFSAMPWLLPLLLVTSLMQPPALQAAEAPVTQRSVVSKLWVWLTQSNDQRAMQLLTDGKADRAAALFDSIDWRLVALYRNADYQGVIDRLDRPTTAREIYLLANSLALTGQTQEAIAAYRKVLILTEATVNQITDDARYNLALLEQSTQPEDADDTEQPEGSESADENSASSDQAGESAANRPASQSQVQSGSNIGGNNTLDQGTLQDDSESGDAVGDDNSVATDATASGQTQLEPITNSAEPEQAGNQVTAEPNNNTVLNPYSEQWLRTLPQDPGGYFRRKLSYTTQLRQQSDQQSGSQNAETPAVTEAEIRY